MKTLHATELISSLLASGAAPHRTISLDVGLDILQSRKLVMEKGTWKEWSMNSIVICRSVSTTGK